MPNQKTRLPAVLGLAAALVLTVPGLQPAAADGDDGVRVTAVQTPSCPQQVLSGMSLAQRAGQLFVAGVTSTGPTDDQLRMIRRHHLGGAILMGHNSAGTSATRRVARQLQAQATTDNVGLWVAADQEGGYVQVLHGPGFSEIPTALAQGDMRPRTLRARALRWGRQLRAAGVNLNLAPVLDTVPARLGRGNRPIGYYFREYGHTPSVVTSHGMAVSDGMRSAGVQTTVKHFPGLGRVRRNTDTSYGVTDKVTTRHDSYLRPFRNAAADRVPVIMVSSARYSRIDPAHLAPFSSTILRGMLRHDLDFTGVIMSDDLGAAQAVSKVAVRRRAVRFLQAGGTVALTVDASTVPRMVRGVLDRARAHRPFRRRVDAAALRVLQVKNRAGLLPCSPAPAPTAPCTAFGTAGDDRLVGTAHADVICARGGADRVFAQAGNDLVHGGTGDDRLHGRRGNDRLIGWGGDDELRGNRGRDVLVGRAGRDLLDGGLGSDGCRGGTGVNRRRSCEH